MITSNSKTRWAVLAAVLILSCNVVQAKGTRDKGGLRLLNMSHGTYKLVLSNHGELLSCESHQNVIRNEGIYDFLDGICDDNGETPCNGRVTFIIEQCTSADTGDYSNGDPLNGDSLNGEAGLLQGTMSEDRPVRICYDEFGSCLESDEVARGTSRNRTINYPNQPMGQSYWSSTITKTKSFHIDGKKARIVRGPQSGSATTEQARGAIGSHRNCLMAGCGFAGAGYRSR